jgi:UTP--glucose-1-phosphate uridylyltransferase
MKTFIRKAVFPVAGFGTRFLPATKAMPKELLPIINKPLIQYAVEDAIGAGCKTLVFVTGRNKRAIEDHFDRNIELELTLEASGRKEEAQMVRHIVPKDVECIFVRQPEQLGLGHAVLCAERAVGNEPFVVLLADDFLISTGASVTSDLINSFNKTGKCQLSLVEVDKENVSKYGIVKPGGDIKSVRGLVEKPDVENAPSCLASIGRYALTPEIFDILRDQEPGHGNEIQLADSINKMALEGKVEGVLFEGERFDCGSFQGYLKAINTVAQKMFGK